MRRSDGSYEKQMALIPETAKVNVGYLPLTKENIAKAMLCNLGDTYGWGGMLNVEDCSGLVRTVYSCFGLDIGRNGNWQFAMNIEKIDMSYMSFEEKCLILDELPLGAALCFPGHEMFYLGKVDGKYYVLSTVSSIMSPDTGKRLRTRDVMINTLDVRRANGQSWLGALNVAFMPCYATEVGKTFDFPTLRWYHDGVAYCLKNGILTNRSDETFGLRETVDRATLAKALWVMAGKPAAEGECTFTDVPADHAARTAIVWAAESGIMVGYSDSTFAPGETLSRQQFVTALWRYDQLQDTPADTHPGELTDFPDADSIRSYAATAFEWAFGAGITTGTESGLLAPDADTTRAQLAVMLHRYSQLPRTELPKSEDAGEEQPS